jgi:hypothetical protein
MDNSHQLLEIISYLPPCLIHLLENMDKNLHASLGPRFQHQVFHHVETGENHALASPGHMGKQPMFNRVVLGTIRGIMRNPNFHPDCIGYGLEVLFKEIMAGVIAPTPVT